MGRERERGSNPVPDVVAAGSRDEVVGRLDVARRVLLVGRLYAEVLCLPRSTSSDPVERPRVGGVTRGYLHLDHEVALHEGRPKAPPDPHQRGTSAQHQQARSGTEVGVIRVEKPPEWSSRPRTGRQRPEWNTSTLTHHRW